MAKTPRVTRSDPFDQLSAGLYIVATPIGNLGDITRRAVDVLERCDMVACEDTRVTGKLLKALDIRKPLRRYNDHSDADDRASLVAAMAGQAVVLASDAGTPLISDPGYRLVREAKEAGVMVTSLPGPCAAIAGLTLSGLPNDRFHFAGFLPVREHARTQILGSVAAIDATVIFYETGPRLVKSLRTIDSSMPGRTVSVARELTKLHEECRTGTASHLAAHYTEHPPKGEIVLMVGPPPPVESTEADVEALLIKALQTLKTSQAAAYVARETGHDRKALYARALELQNT